MSETIYSYETEIPAEEPLKPANMLESLRQDMATPSPKQTWRSKVPQRPGYVVEFDTRLDWDIYRRFLKEAGSGTPDYDVLKESALILAQQCRGIELDGEAITDDESGEKITFRSKRLFEITESISTREMLRKFYDNDFDMIQAAGEIAERAGAKPKGMDAEEKPLDPTVTSSD